MYQGVYIVETELFEAFFLLNKQMTKFFMMSVFEDISPAKLYFVIDSHFIHIELFVNANQCI